MARDIFFEQDLSGYLESLKAQMVAAVQSESTDYLLNVDEEEYAQNVAARFHLEHLVIHFDDIFISTREEEIPAERFPPDFFVRAGKRYPKQIIRYHIPYEGTERLLLCKPNPSVLNTYPVELDQGYICFEVTDFYQDAERIKREAQPVIDLIRRQSDYVTKNVEAYNAQLLNQVREAVSGRKGLLGKRIDVLGSLGVPVKKTEHVPDTFRIPDLRRKVIPRPQVPRGAEQSEPTLGEDVYEEILKVIHDTGKVFERLPSTYAGKDEETLRDHLILQLEPRFEGSTTGETFNKAGKTDILIRHEKSNVFVAECLWWDGPQKYLAKIDQLLSYLTWRDSKSAVVCFVDRADFSYVLTQIAETTRQHACHMRFIGERDETWRDFEFHLPGDEGRKLRVAVLAFHLPKKG